MFVALLAMASATLPAEQVHFSHATNSLAKLEEALHSDEVNFIEADVMMAEDGESVIMCHPPERESDLSISDFLDSIAEHNHQGSGRRLRVKLDFKEPQTLRPSLETLQRIQEKRGSGIFPELWLNADVLQGPGGVPSSFDADEFCTICKEAFPSAVLSLGWKVSSSVLEGYSEEQAEEMLGLCERHNVKGTGATFALSAFHATQRPQMVTKLLAPGHTVTLWGPANSTCDSWIQELRSEYPGKIYVDTREPDFLQRVVWGLGQYLGLLN